MNEETISMNEETEPVETTIEEQGTVLDDETGTEPVQRQYRYIKRIIMYVILAVLCFATGMIGFGFFMLFLAGGFAFFSYVQRDKYSTSAEELAFKLWKKHRKEKKASVKSEKELRDEQYKHRLAEIEKEFDFDYGDKVPFVCTSCNTKTKITFRNQKKVECPVCNGKMIPEAELMPQETADELI